MSTTKKILFVITKSSFGGAGRYVFDLATKLHGNGYEVKILMGGDGILFHKFKDVQIPTIKIPGLGRDISPLNELRAMLFLYRHLRSERPDIVHLNSSKAGLGALASRFARVPKIIFTLHGLAVNENRSRFQKIIISFFYWLTIILCHKTIAVSHSLYRQATSSLPFISKKIYVVHNGISPFDHHSKLIARDILKKSIISQTVPDFEIASLYIGTIGELHPIKGHNYLFEGFREALHESPLPLYLFIIGDGEEKQDNLKQIEELELQDNVFLCGHIDNAPTILKALDIFILPSLSEGLPYALLEAGMVSLPSIASNVGGIPEIIKDSEEGILIQPRSTSDITEAILTLTFDPTIRKTLGSALHNKIASDFTIEKMVTETENIYSSDK